MSTKKQAITILLLPEDRWCERCLATNTVQSHVYTGYGVSIDNGPFKALCINCIPDGALQEYWTQRLFQDLRDGSNDEKARAILSQIISLVQVDTAKHCERIAKVVAQDAQLAYSDKAVAAEVRRAANDIAFAIRIMEHDWSDTPWLKPGACP
jgi:uncharacterized protein CbrC (UPF0167 family)